jgi:hypothetical protein
VALLSWGVRILPVVAASSLQVPDSLSPCTVLLRITA